MERSTTPLPSMPHSCAQSSTGSWQQTTLPLDYVSPENLSLASIKAACNIACDAEIKPTVMLLVARRQPHSRSLPRPPQQWRSSQQASSRPSQIFLLLAHV